MEQGQLLLLMLGFSGLGIAGVVLFFLLAGGSERSRMKNLVSSQRSGGRLKAFGFAVGKDQSVYDTAKESQVRKKVTSKLTLRKKLKFGQWRYVSPVLYYVTQVFLAFLFWAISAKGFDFNLGIQFIAFIMGPILVGWALNRAIDKRFTAFDKDYPQMLNSLVGLLKTGMNPIQALEAAAQGLEEGSLCKAEVELMVERLRFGVSEDKSIGAFGEDVYHPEIELFVQALLLSRRVGGGSLGDTLERLAKQVRKRQYFRSSARAAIGMQRGSIYFILFILFMLELYLYFVFPEAITEAWNDPMGWQVWQTGLIVIFLGMFWIRQVTKIRV